MVQAFVNTVDFENGVEELSGPDALHQALVRAGALDEEAPSLRKHDLEQALAVREALRDLLLANNGPGLGRNLPDARGTLERAARAAQLRLRFREDGTAELVPAASGVDCALGRILAVVFGAMADGTWQRLKACRRDVCHWAFYDRSKNRSSTWCAMSVCGNRTKARRRAGRG